MPIMTLDPRLPDFFVEMDWLERGRKAAAFDDELVRNYEAGNVILLKNPPFRIASDVFRRISFPAGDDYKKLHAPSLLRPKLYKPRVVKLLFSVFGTDAGLYLGFRRAVMDLTAQLTDFCHTVFRSYRFAKQDVNWRFTPTGPEPLHFDMVRSTADLQYVRVFVNLDDAPRVWRVGPQLEGMIERFYDVAKLDELQGAHANEICHRITYQVLERWQEVAGGTVPRHHVEFQPGEVWLCESRINSHEIYSGNRAVITHFHADPKSMLDPQLSVGARVARAMQRGRSPATVNQ
jgi:hypothetical protein